MSSHFEHVWIFLLTFRRPRLCSQPDLVERLRHDLPLTKYNRETFYTLGPEATHGYTDYERAVVQEELTAVEGKQ